MKNLKKDNILYGNCKVYSPDNILMFLCDHKKAKWYVDRNLAKITSKIPFSIKLSFKPNGLGHSNKEYGIMQMDNACVVCGSPDFLTRHHVVPFCYRQFSRLLINQEIIMMYWLFALIVIKNTRKKQVY